MWSMPGKKLMNIDTFSSLFLVLFAFWVCYLSKRLLLWSPEGPSDGFFPFLGGLALGFFGLCLFFRSLLNPGQISTVKEATTKTRLLIYIGSLIAYALFFELLGFLLATFFFLFAIGKGAEKASWKNSLIISGLSTATCFFVFYYLLDVPFPLGLLKALF